MDYTITPEEAKGRIAAWKKDQQAIQNELDEPGLINSPVLGINAFTFHLNDLYELFIRIYKFNNPEEPLLPFPEATCENPINAVRFYVGEKSAEDAPDGKVACLIGVGVTGFVSELEDGGRDVLDLPPGDEEELSSVYDFSFPCPTTCAQSGHSIVDHTKTHRPLNKL